MFVEVKYGVSTSMFFYYNQEGGNGKYDWDMSSLEKKNVIVIFFVPSFMRLNNSILI